MNRTRSPQQPTEHELPLLDLDAARGRLGGSAAALREVAQAVETAVPELLARLDAPANAAQVAHELAGAFAAVGARRAEAAARALEAAARDDRVTPSALRRVHAVAGVTLAALRSALEAGGAGPPP